jgi:hypothetical protein
MNVAPLQLQAPSSSQPPLMNIGNMPPPQDSGTSIHQNLEMIAQVSPMVPQTIAPISFAPNLAMPQETRTQSWPKSTTSPV